MLLININKPIRDIRGRLRTSSLFLESFDYQDLDPSVYQPLWTLGDGPRVLDPNHVFYDRVYSDNTFPSLRQLYLEWADPVEFNFAEAVFGSDKTWKVLCRAPWFQPYLEEYRQALDQKIRSENVKRIQVIAALGDKNSLAAAKWLAEQGYRPKEAKGRPSKQDKAHALALEQVQDKMLLEDAERIGIKKS